MKEKNVIPLPSRALSQEIKIQFTTSNFPGNTLISCGYTLKAFPRKVESYYQHIRENVMKTISKKKQSFEHIREKHHHRQQDPFHFVEIILEYDLQGCSDLKTNLKCNFFPESGIRFWRGCPAWYQGGRSCATARPPISTSAGAPALAGSPSIRAFVAKTVLMRITR